jgi:hypothetical protein
MKAMAANADFKSGFQIQIRISDSNPDFRFKSGFQIQIRISDSNPHFRFKSGFQISNPDFRFQTQSLKFETPVL